MKRKLRVVSFSINKGFCYYYRLNYPLKRLHDLGYIEWTDASAGNVIEMLELAADNDVIIMQGANPPEILVRMQALIHEKKLNKIIISEFDDDMFSIDVVNPAYGKYGIEEVSMEVDGEKKFLYKDGVDGFSIEENTARLEGLSRGIIASDLITTTTDILADRFKLLNENVFVVRNVLDFSNMPNQNATKKKDSPKEVVISWAGGDCVDDKTEILTDSGWKYINKLDKTEKVATLNNDGVIEYHKPYEYIDKEYDGDVYICENKNVNYFVTGNHKMYASTTDSLSVKTSNYELVKHKEISDSDFYLKRDAEWIGEEIEYFTIPHSDITVKMDDWLKFFGFWIADGWTTSNIKQVGVAQSKDNDYLKEMEDILLSFGLKPYYTKDKKQLRVFGDSLYAYLKEFGKAHDKFVPSFIKQLSKRQINIFLEWYINGDGNRSGNRVRAYTVSKALADDIQELALKARKGASISLREKRSDNWRQCYTISIYDNDKSTKAYRPLVKKDDYIKTHYNGRVYCVSVENHNWYMRRNGKTMWTGNSHYGDIKRIMPVLKQIQEEYKGIVKFRFFGARFDKLYSQLDHELIPWIKPNLYFDRFSSMLPDIGLIPLEDTEFNRAKSNIKWLEYSYYGIPSVVENVSPYKEDIKDGITALAYKDGKKLYENIKKLIDDPLLRSKIAYNAKKYVMRNYNIENEAIKWYNLFINTLDAKKSILK